MKKFRIVLLLLCLSSPLYSQSGNVRGVVVDGKTHELLPNAAVNLKELATGDVTNKYGEFEFTNIPYGSYTLEISFVGYKPVTQRININQQDMYGVLIHLYPIMIETQTIVVTGEHFNSRFDNIREFAHTLKGKELEKDMGLTLGATLKNEAGLSIRSMGPAPARPVIRGLSGDRVMVSEDGINTTDLSASSPDHAVSVEPFTVERIEVIRGPKSLMQNSSTIGGIVNVIREDIPAGVYSRIEGTAGLYGETANSGYLYSGMIRIPAGGFNLKGEYTGRRAEDLKTPKAKLINSDITSSNYSGGLSYAGAWGFTGLSIREFNSDYGIPGGFVGAHPNGVDIKMFKRQVSAKLNYNPGYDHLEQINIDASRDYYHHQEFESADLIGAEFSIYNYSGRIDLTTRHLPFMESGNIGISYDHRDFNIGGFVFTSPTISKRYSAYIYQTFPTGNFSFEFAGRYQHDDLKPRQAARSAKPEYLVRRTFNTFSLSLSGLYEINGGWYTGINISRSSRVPTIEELYSEGPHLAAYSYETGNPSLEDEKGIGTEAFIYYDNSNLFAMLTLFRNDLSYYILPRNSGKINYATLLPVYQSIGVRAMLQGIESQVNLSISKNIRASANFSYTYGELKNEGTPLPSIPPLRSLIELKYVQGNLNAGIVSEIAGSQKRVDIFEEPTAGYIIFNSFIQYSFVHSTMVHNLSVNAENILDKEYRNHLSRVKSVMPEAGRNFRLVYKFYF